MNEPFYAPRLSHTDTFALMTQNTILGKSNEQGQRMVQRNSEVAYITIPLFPGPVVQDMCKRQGLTRGSVMVLVHMVESQDLSIKMQSNGSEKMLTLQKFC